MHRANIIVPMSVLWLMAAPNGAWGTEAGRDLYVSPNGSPAGPGTMTRPYDLVTALSGTPAVPGDTFWLRGGNYAMGHVNTRIRGEPGRPVTFRQMPGEKARVDGTLTIFGSPGHVIFMDFELYGSDTNRVSSQTGAGINPPPSDIRPVIGIECHAPNFSFINLVVRDHTRSGIYISEVSSNTLVYGCLVYNNGWASADNAEGHGIYVQSHVGAREIADNVVFNSAGANFHVYESRAGGRLASVTIEGNVAFHAGALQAVRRYPDWIVGVDAPAVGADQIVLRDNMGYLPPGSGAPDQAQIGREGINGSVAILGNYLPLGVALNNWTIAAVTGNVIAPQSTNPVVRLNQTQTPLAAAWNDNAYARAIPGSDFQYNSEAFGFAAWRQATGYDANSTYTVGAFTGTKVFVRPNRHEPGRALIVAYNWDNLAAVAVDVASVLPVGAAYEVLNVQNLGAPPALSGVYDGSPLQLPMNGLTVAPPNGPMRTPPPTGPTFNVFLLRKRHARLEIRRAQDAVELFWPTNSGLHVLQFRDTATTAGTWTESSIHPSIRGDEYVVVHPTSAAMRFFRLGIR